jgi:hypothetical protein
MGWFSGSRNRYRQLSTLTPEQQRAHGQLGAANAGPGAGGAFGDTADYYRNLLSDNSADFNAFAAPQMRQFNEDILPGISEQFAGMGAGGLSSSGFQNAAINAGTDLSERLGAIRAQLRQQGAQGLQSIGQQYLNPVTENVMEQGQPGFGHGLASGLGGALPGAAIGFATGGPAGAAAGAANGFANGVNKTGVNKTSLGGNKVGANTSPYGGGNMSASPQLPNFLQGPRGF